MTTAVAGEKTLVDACTAARVNFIEVQTALEKPVPEAKDRDWQKASLAELVAHIVAKHHRFTRQEIARLVPLMAKVQGVHGQNHPELNEVQGLFQGLAQEMTMRMMKEEHMLFPYIEQLEEAVNRGAQPAQTMFETVQNPVRLMMMEHDSSDEALRRIRGLTGIYAAPADACVSYQILYNALHGFDADLHQHIHLENNILFPRAMALESRAF